MQAHKIDFLACERHNFDHLLPVWKLIHEKYRGQFHILTEIDNKDHFSNSPFPLCFHDSSNDITQHLNAHKNIIVTSSFYDNFLIDIERPLIFISHGGGQTYIGQYEYQISRKNYYLDILPNHHTSAIFKQRYHQSKKIVVGSPKMDAWHKNFNKSKNPRPVIAISFHFDRKAIPESRSAWPHFETIIEKLAHQDRWKILGHGHPRMLDILSPSYKKYGIEIITNFEKILECADIYICDNSSTLYEFASIDKPVIVLNAPWYRRDVEHGLRFWEHATVGINCDHPDDLMQAIELALLDLPEQQEKRKKAVHGVYAYTDGNAASRAAEAIMAFAGSWDESASLLYPGTQKKQIEHFINKKEFNTDLLSHKIEHHKHEILKMINSANINYHFHMKDFEFHIWAILLLLLKAQNIDEVKKIFAQCSPLCPDSEILKPIFDKIRTFFHTHSKSESALRMARYYADKGNIDKANLYIKLAKNNRD